ncbi:MAG: hypothetical protein AAF616_11870 [Bacteroidota bacterium]
MSLSKTIGTIIASVAIGTLAFLFTTPKKVNKRKDVKPTISQDEVVNQDDLFI